MTKEESKKTLTSRTATNILIGYVSNTHNHTQEELVAFIKDSDDAQGALKYAPNLTQDNKKALSNQIKKRSYSIIGY